MLDQWNDSPHFKGLSWYNKATKSNFFSDGQIEAIDDYVVNEYAEELDGLEREKVAERLAANDGQAAADTSGALSRLLARYRLIRAECWERMLNDPGFRKTLVQESEDTGSDLPKQWAQQISADRMFVMQRSGVAGMIPLRRC